MNQDIAHFAAGCFWGVEAAFRKLPGVLDVRAGYMGGAAAHPSYEEVCSGATGHAEAVEVIFDPAKISYKDLLQFFWTCHDPTQLNRQGPDVGTQYRSAIFYHGDAQGAEAQTAKQALEKQGYKIMTEIAPAPEFFPAEDYHQNYVQKQKQLIGS